MSGYFTFTGYELVEEKESLVRAIKLGQDKYRNRILLRYVNLLLDSYPAKGLSMGDRFSDLPVHRRHPIDDRAFYNYFELQEKLKYLIHGLHWYTDALTIINEMRLRRFLGIPKQENFFNTLYKLGIEEEF